MKISCAYCQSDFEGNITRYEFGWRSKYHDSKTGRCNW